MLYPCPQCNNIHNICKNGHYIRKSDKAKIQSFLCKSCGKSFSAQTYSVDYRLRIRAINQQLYRLLCKGQSQRAAAYLLNIDRNAVARRILRFSKISELNLENYRLSRRKVEKVQFDELETFEHTKCKPVTAAIAVEKNTRKILSFAIGRLSASGPLKKKSEAKYGKIISERKQTLETFFKGLTSCVREDATLFSDQSPFYPPLVKKYFPNAIHKTYKGRRAAAVGQGELKRGGFDPLFSLNHTYAMFRDNLKRLTRRTWCTSKSIKHLGFLLSMYAWFHNQYLDYGKKQFELRYEASRISKAS